MKMYQSKYYLRFFAASLLSLLLSGCSEEKDTATLNLELLQATSTVDRDIGDIEDLLEDGAEVNAQDQNGETALLQASDRGDMELATILLASSADVNLSNAKSISPLFRASVGGHDDLAALLIENGANVNLATTEGISPLEAATASGRDEIVTLLLRNRAKRKMKPVGKMILQQSFEVKLPYFGDVIFAPHFDPERSGQFRFYLLRDGRPLYEFDNYSGNIWPAEKILAIAFRDINEDGDLDIVIISRHNNGAFEESLEQIDVASVYLFGGDKYAEDYGLSKELESQQKTILGVLRYIASKSVNESPPLLEE